MKYTTFKNPVLLDAVHLWCFIRPRYIYDLWMKSGILFLFFLLGMFSSLAQTPLVLLHTNDVHSQLEPYTSDDKYNADKAGIVRREALIHEVRSTEPNVLVFEAGDFVQGTPYFNFFKGEAEIKLMNYLKLDAITLGNHELDNGLKFLAKMLKKANFPVVCTNYDISKTPLSKIVKQWLVLKCGKLRIGIVGANINPEGLVMHSNYEGLIYLDPISTIEARSKWLKESKKCDIVICLSHLGLENTNGKPDDLTMGKNTKYIDVIIGGHSHTYLKKPVLCPNSNGDTVVINQVGKGGIYVGRLDLMVGNRSKY